MTRRLRYSERKRLTETGSLGDLTEEVPTALRNAVSRRAPPLAPLARGGP